MPQAKILIVDDSKDILEGMKMFLEIKKYIVKTVFDASKRSEDIKEVNPEVLILDIYLSGLDGRELCKDLKTSTKNRLLKIILFSAATQALEDYKSYGADAYLEKPFGLEEIYAKIESVLAN